MVRGDNHDVSGGARRARLTSRRRRRRRRRPLRGRRIRLTRRRGIPRRRRLRVRAGTNAGLNRVRLSRDNIQLHPTSATVPRLVSYSPSAAQQYVSKATGAVQYLTVPDYAGYQLDTASQASPILIQLQKPLRSSSLGLVEDIQVIGLADRKATTSFDDRQQGNFGNYATMSDGEVMVPVTVRQSPQDFTSHASQEVLVPLQVNTYLGQTART